MRRACTGHHLPRQIDTVNNALEMPSCNTIIVDARQI